MTCRDFKRNWNALLDARDQPAPELERALEAHAAACPACQAVGQKYQTLRQAVRAWGPAPSASPGFAARCLQAHAGQAEGARRPRFGPVTLRGAWAGLAAAATVLVAGLLVFRAVTSGPRRGPVEAPEVAVSVLPPSAVAQPVRPLSAALADAASATWDLARTASEPAARVGTDVLGSDEPLALLTRAEGAGPPARPLPIPDEARPPSGVLQKVGDRINAGVRPISGSARQAFGFLLDPALGDRPKPGA